MSSGLSCTGTYRNGRSTGEEEIRVRTIGQNYDQYDFEEIIVLSRLDGTSLRLGDIAELRDGFADTDPDHALQRQPGGSRGLSLTLFLEIRLAVWVGAGLVVSLIGTLWVMRILGISINMFPMLALVLALGIVVDDAIVVGENILAERKRAATAIGRWLSRVQHSVEATGRRLHADISELSSSRYRRWGTSPPANSSRRGGKRRQRCRK